MARQDEYFRAIASRRLVRPSVRGVCIRSGRVLVQQPTDEPGSCFAFIGGEYEVGDANADASYRTLRHLVVPFAGA